MLRVTNFLVFMSILYVLTWHEVFEWFPIFHKNWWRLLKCRLVQPFKSVTVIPALLGDPLTDLDPLTLTRGPTLSRITSKGRGISKCCYKGTRPSLSYSVSLLELSLLDRVRRVLGRVTSTRSSMYPTRPSDFAAACYLDYAEVPMWIISAISFLSQSNLIYTLSLKLSSPSLFLWSFT